MPRGHEALERTQPPPHRTDHGERAGSGQGGGRGGDEARIPMDGSTSGVACHSQNHRPAVASTGPHSLSTLGRPHDCLPHAPPPSVADFKNPLATMQNENKEIVDLYIPRKCSWTNRLIEAKDKASVQVRRRPVATPPCPPPAPPPPTPPLPPSTNTNTNTTHRPSRTVRRRRHRPGLGPLHRRHQDHRHCGLRAPPLRVGHGGVAPPHQGHPVRGHPEISDGSVVREGWP